jgi:hypothetical protein
MEDEHKVFIILIISIAIVILIPTILHYNFINQCVEQGLSQVQDIGSQSYHWEK